MHLRLDHSSGEPIYRQIVEQIKYRIASGQLSPSQKLPSIRILAGELKINPRTVVKAYEELSHAGLLVMRQGQGVFVAEQRQTTPTEVRRKVIAQLARRLLSEASRLGADGTEVLEILQAEARHMESEDESTSD